MNIQSNCHMQHIKENDSDEYTVELLHATHQREAINAINNNLPQISDKYCLTLRYITSMIYYHNFNQYSVCLFKPVGLEPPFKHS